MKLVHLEGVSLEGHYVAHLLHETAVAEGEHLACVVERYLAFVLIA